MLLEELYQYFPKEKNELHFNRYNKFIVSRKNRQLEEGSYTESHHIVPKSFIDEQVKNKEEDNLIILTAREHYIAHLMLWKAFGGKMAQAFFMMTSFSRYESKLTSRKYSSLREACSKIISKRMKGAGNPFFGKISPFKGKHFSKESSEKLSKSNSGRIVINNGKISKRVKEENLDYFLHIGWNIGLDDNTIKNSSEARKGFKHSIETKSKLSRIRKNSFYITNADKTQEKFIFSEKDIPEGWTLGRKKFSEEHIKNIGNSSKGRGKGKCIINNSLIEKRIFETDLDKYLADGWKKGRKFSSNRGRTWVHKDLERKMITEDDLELYLSNGWTKGLKLNA